jgi:hypothetical protein
MAPAHPSCLLPLKRIKLNNEESFQENPSILATDLMVGGHCLSQFGGK